MAKDKKTVQITVNFFVQVPKEANTETLFIDVPKENIKIMDERNLSVLENCQINEYETMIAEEI